LLTIARLRITADISHHVVAAERLLNSGPDDEKVVATYIPHVRRDDTAMIILY
jgi:hypothetical protein